MGLQKTDPLQPEALTEYLDIILLRPKDIQGLSAKSHSILLGEERDSWSAVTVSYAGIDAIIYNSSHSKARQFSDIMHEISHILLGHKPTSFILFSQNEQIVLRSYDQTQEDEAGWLAGCLLLPREVLLLIERSALDNREACKTYGVSYNLLNFRMNVSGVNLQVSREKT